MQQTTLIANIRAEMARNGKTQTDLAQLLGITRQSVSQRMLGRVDFRVSEVQAIATSLNVTVADLIGEAAA